MTGPQPRLVWRRFSETLASLRTGVVLLILLGIVAATGTFVLQRPQTDPEKLLNAYSPQALWWLDKLGLTDVFHSWWFAALLLLLGLNLVFASVERFPIAWRYIRRPYRRPEPHFLAGLTLQSEIAIPTAERGIAAAEYVFRKMGYRPRRVASPGSASVYVERNRFSRLAPYVVHASLLLIFGGATVDAIWGYRGFLTLTDGQQASQIEWAPNQAKALPFTIRCDGAGQENYPDGTPRRWWSKLVVIDRGREVEKKEIAVNDPLVYRGVRFYQSSYGSTGQLSTLELRVRPTSNPGRAQQIVLRPRTVVSLDANTSVRLGAFFPDFVLVGKEIQNRSDQPNNPAIQLLIESRKASASNIWLFPRYPEFAHPSASPYSFDVLDLQMGYFTGLQVSHEPGQWAVWAGVLLIGVGLAMAFYFIHVRLWAVPVSDDRGRLVLWVGASTNKNRADLEERFRGLVAEMELSVAGGFAAGRERSPQRRVSASKAAYPAVNQG